MTQAKRYTQACPVVGMFFRPPAKVLIAHLPTDFPLMLMPEPSNPYDKNAIAVWIDGSLIPTSEHEDLEAELPPFGHELSDVLSNEWHLGYIAKEYAARLIDSLNLAITESGDVAWPAALKVAGDKYTAEFTL